MRKPNLKCWLLGVLVLVCGVPAWATTTVTGKIQNLGTGNISAGAFVRFWLRGCAGNQPRINGTALIGPSQGGVFYFDIAADSNGNISGTLYSTRDNTGNGNGDIECGGSKTAVWYGMQAFVGGRGGPEIPVHAKSGAVLDITQVTPITTNPVVTPPTGDNTYLRLDAGNSPITGNLSLIGTLSMPIINNITYVDGTKYTTIQSCINAAAALLTPGTCIVPTGTANTSQVEMASGVSLIFMGGTFTDTSATGGVFINFGPTVVGASVCGQGIGATTLRNNSTGTQFGAVIQDQGTNDTVCNLTLNGNSNTTSTMVSMKASQPHYRNLTVDADTTVVAGHNYALDVRGGSTFDVSGITTNGGSLGGLSIVTKDLSGDYGTITGGNFTDLMLENSPHNGLDINVNASATSSANSINSLQFSNVFTKNNGTADGPDDSFGATFNSQLVSGDTGSINNIMVSNLYAIGNKGSGVVLHGSVFNSTFIVNSAGNGSGIGGAPKDAIVFRNGLGSAAPEFNTFIATGNKGGATNFFSSEANSSNNLLVFNASDPIALGNKLNTFVAQTGVSGLLELPQVSFSLETYSACPAGPAITNLASVGVTLCGPNSSANGNFSAPNVTDSALTSGNCVQPGAGGLLATLAGPCVIGGANGLSAGTVTLVAGAGSHTFTAPYSVAPVCTAVDTTSAAAVKATSSTTVVTLAGTATDVISWSCSPAEN